MACKQIKGMRQKYRKDEDRESEIIKTLQENNCKFVKYEVINQRGYITYLPLCGHEHRVRMDGFKTIQKNQCPSCLRANLKGEYNPMNAFKNKQSWKDEPSKVYIMKCSDDNEEFYKIGITKQKMYARTTVIPYDEKALIVLHTNLYDAIMLEKKFHKMNEELEYEPNVTFNGNTECFSDIKEEIVNILLEKGGDLHG